MSSGSLPIIKSGEKGWRERRGVEERQSVKVERQKERKREGKKRAHTSGAVTSRCRDGGEGRPRA